MDLIITNCALRHRDGLFDIGISAGKIKKIAAASTLHDENATVIDADKNLVTESFCNAHMHLCKV